MVYPMRVFKTSDNHCISRVFKNPTFCPDEGGGRKMTYMQLKNTPASSEFDKTRQSNS